MKILAVDTATQRCSVALVDDKSVISEYSVDHKDTHSKFVMGMIHEVLTTSGLTVDDLNGLAVTVGPGSFTGLRIGLSTVEGLAFAGGKPVTGISTLEALAYALYGTQLLICPILDARRKEVYTGRYRFHGQNLVCASPPMVVGLRESLADIRTSAIFIGDATDAYRDMIDHCLGELAVFAPPSQNYIRASVVGHLAMVRFTMEGAVDPAQLTPVYLRKSDAEKKFKTRISGQQNDNCL